MPASATSIRPKDYITLSKKFAVEHAVTSAIYKDEPFKVVMKVVDKDKILSADNPGEYLWGGEELPVKRALAYANTEGEVSRAPVSEKLSRFIESIVAEIVLDEAQIDRALEQNPEFSIALGRMRDVKPKYLTWFIKQLKRLGATNDSKQIQNGYIEDEGETVELSHIPAQFNDFESLVKSGTIKDKDINRYPTFGNFVKTLKAAKSDQQTKQKEKEDEADREVIYKDDRFLVMKPNTTACSKKYGVDTKWCISGEEGNMFDTYTKSGAHFLFLQDKQRARRDQKDAIAWIPKLVGKSPVGVEIYNSRDEYIYDDELMSKYPPEVINAAFGYIGYDPTLRKSIFRDSNVELITMKNNPGKLYIIIKDPEAEAGDDGIGGYIPRIYSIKKKGEDFLFFEVELGADGGDEYRLESTAAFMRLFSNDLDATTSQPFAKNYYQKIEEFFGKSIFDVGSMYFSDIDSVPVNGEEVFSTLRQNSLGLRRPTPKDIEILDSFANKAREVIYHFQSMHNAEALAKGYALYKSKVRTYLDNIFDLGMVMVLNGKNFTKRPEHASYYKQFFGPYLDSMKNTATTYGKWHDFIKGMLQSEIQQNPPESAEHEAYAQIKHEIRQDKLTTDRLLRAINEFTTLLPEERINKKGYTQMGSSLPDHLYNNKDGKPSRDTGLVGRESEDIKKEDNDTLERNRSKKKHWYNVKEELYYHGTTADLEVGDYILPPLDTKRMSEKGRKKNLNKVFMTKDVGSAKVYAGRAKQSLGGIPKIYVVEPEGDVETLNATPGTTVMMAPRAKIVKKL